jgi:hypothetical protein
VTDFIGNKSTLCCCWHHRYHISPLSPPLRNVRREEEEVHGQKYSPETLRFWKHQDHRQQTASKREENMSGRANNDNRRELCRGSTGTSFRARRWLSLDPCGCSGVLLSWSVHFYALVIIPLKITSNSVIATLLYFAVYIPASLLAMTSLLQAWTTNPGAVPMGARPLTIVRRASSSLSAHSSGSGENGNLQVQNQRGVRRCHKCNDNYKPPRAHHDSVTGRWYVLLTSL